MKNYSFKAYWRKRIKELNSITKVKKHEDYIISNTCSVFKFTFDCGQYVFHKKFHKDIQENINGIFSEKYGIYGPLPSCHIFNNLKTANAPN